METREPTLEEIEEARGRIAGSAIRTPLIRLDIDDGPDQLWVKLENLQPIGSFKLRGAGNALAILSESQPDRLARGVYTASAGNMAQGVAWCARRLGLPSWSVVPDTAPQTKLAGIARLGMEAVKVPFDEWWGVLESHRFGPLADRAFVHPVSDPAVMAGNGTIGLEILEDLPDVEAVIVPYGGGGLSSGIAAGMHAHRPDLPVFAAEVETAAPFAASLAAGEPHPIAYAPSFVDGIGSRSVLPEMWPIARRLLAGAIVVTLAQTAEAIRLLAERAHVIAEGAGATSVAAARTRWAGTGTVVCVVSGGNIDPAKLATILGGGIP